MADYEQAMKQGEEPRTIDEQECQEGFRLGREQGAREVQALAVNYVRYRAATRTSSGDNLGAYIINDVADKLEKMKMIDTRTGETMPGYASHILEGYLRETRGTAPPVDGLDQYQLEMVRFWLMHLEHVLREHIPGQESLINAIMAEFLYGAAPRPYDAMERTRLATLARDAIMTTNRPRFTPDRTE